MLFSQKVRLSFNLTLTRIPMRAILLKRGLFCHVYLLENEEYNEVKDFFDKNKNQKNKKAIVSGFIKYINYIADNGTYSLSDKIFKCWKKNKNDQICELKKGEDRISFFFHGEQKVLLCTHFVKSRSKEKREYKRAIKLNKKFTENSKWET